jgi:hypothetical protein
MEGAVSLPESVGTRERQAFAELTRKLREAFPAVDEHVIAIGCLDEDGVRCAHVEEGDVQFAVGDGKHRAPDEDGE